MLVESPEKRLLNLIRKKHKPKTDSGREKAHQLKTFLSGLIKIFILPNKVFKPLFLKSINRVLALVLVILSAYLLLSFFFPLNRDLEFLDKENEELSLDEAAARKLEAVRFPDYSLYSRQIKNKDLFRPNFSDTKVQAEASVDISKKFSLVGIIAGNRPQAVIEDKELKKTYYLYSGESFSGVIVEEVGEGNVVLNYMGRQVELVL